MTKYLFSVRFKNHLKPDKTKYYWVIVHRVQQQPVAVFVERKPGGLKESTKGNCE